MFSLSVSRFNPEETKSAYPESESSCADVKSSTVCPVGSRISQVGIVSTGMIGSKDGEVSGKDTGLTTLSSSVTGTEPFALTDSPSPMTSGIATGDGVMGEMSKSIGVLHMALDGDENFENGSEFVIGNASAGTNAV
jgi:hypothetical protein